LRNTEFLNQYQQLKNRFAIEKNLTNSVSQTNIEQFFCPFKMNAQRFSNVQWLNFDNFKGQLLASSYIPLPGYKEYDTMIAELAQLFVLFNQNGLVHMEYETRTYWNTIN
jgi:hypothetical protein